MTDKVKVWRYSLIKKDDEIRYVNTHEVEISKETYDMFKWDKIVCLEYPQGMFIHFLSNQKVVVDAFAIGLNTEYNKDRIFENLFDKYITIMANQKEGLKNVAQDMEKGKYDVD